MRAKTTRGLGAEPVPGRRQRVRAKRGPMTGSAPIPGTPLPALRAAGFMAAFDPNHCAGSRIGIEDTHAVGFPLPTGVPMISHTHQNLTEATSHGFGRIGGYALVAILAILLLVALLTNPALPL
jgi:hypothetical protein